ncbi:MAG: response regulator [Chloroflexota bacterium]
MGIGRLLWAEWLSTCISYILDHKIIVTGHIMQNLDSEIFEQYVRDCLTHLYDYQFLQDHPLVHLLAPDAQGSATRVQMFRQVIADGIERLQPSAETSQQSKTVRIYTILVLRYLNQQPVQYVLYKLNVGERQFYRDHTKAVQTLSRVLAEHAQALAQVNTISIQSEIQRVHGQNEPQQINIKDFVEKTLTVIQELVDRYCVRITVEVADCEMPIGHDQFVLRQAIIWIFSHIIIQSYVTKQFRLLLDINEQEYRFIFKGDETLIATQELQILPERQHTLQPLVNALGGRILEQMSLGAPYYAILEVPLKKRSLLIIDDNPDAITLFNRYILGQPFQIVTTSDGIEAIQIAQEVQPEVVILDIMLPRQDGWEILHNLKNHPATMHIPVLICSVLNTPDLAVLLGADGFLRKPPGEQDFLNALAYFERTSQVPH